MHDISNYRSASRFMFQDTECKVIIVPCSGALGLTFNWSLELSLDVFTTRKTYKFIYGLVAENVLLPFLQTVSYFKTYARV